MQIDFSPLTMEKRNLKSGKEKEIGFTWTIRNMGTQFSLDDNAKRWT